jgi:hypothetical protein
MKYLIRASIAKSEVWNGMKDTLKIFHISITFGGVAAKVSDSGLAPSWLHLLWTLSSVWTNRIH